MREYETVYIFDSALEEERITEKLDRFHELVAGATGEIAAVDHWGKRALAYPIGAHENGYFVVSHYTAESDAFPEFERALKLDDDLLRYLVVVNEDGLTTTPTTIELDPDDDDDDDDDDDRDDED